MISITRKDKKVYVNLTANISGAQLLINALNDALSENVKHYYNLGYRHGKNKKARYL